MVYVGDDAEVAEAGDGDAGDALFDFGGIVEGLCGGVVGGRAGEWPLMM